MQIIIHDNFPYIVLCNQTKTMAGKYRLFLIIKKDGNLGIYSEPLLKDNSRAAPPSILSKIISEEIIRTKFPKYYKNQ